MTNSKTQWCCVVGVVALLALPLSAEDPRPIQGRGLDNLVAFTKLLGYVRYFHPSDEAAEADWDQFAHHGVGSVEDAANPTELAQRLETLFAPIAPTVQVFPAGDAPPEHAQWAAALASDAPRTAWEHLGVGISQNTPYSSRRINKSESIAAFGGINSSFNAERYRGRTVRLRLALRAEVDTPTSLAYAWLRVDDESGDVLLLRNTAVGRRPSQNWSVFEVSAFVDPTASRVVFGAVLDGTGSAWADSVTIEALSADGSIELIRRDDFESSQEGDRPEGWGATRAARGYSIFVTAANPYLGSQSVAIVSDGNDTVPDAVPLSEVLDLGGGLQARVPLVLGLAASQTTPAGEPLNLAAAELDGNDRTTRLAAVALAWNIFQHFYPYFDVVDVDWHDALRRTLTQAAVDNDAVAFGWTLRAFVAELQDGHGAVFAPGPARYRAPFAWRWIEGRLVITHTLPGFDVPLRVGDIVRSIDGEDAATAVGRMMRFASGATEARRRLIALRLLYGGPKDSLVEMEVDKVDGGREIVTLARTVSILDHRERPPADKIREIEPGVFYVGLYEFESGRDDYYRVLPKLLAAKAIVFDARGYPTLSFSSIGHLIDGQVSSSLWRIPTPSRPDRQDLTFDPSNWFVQPEPQRITAKVVFLTNERAISRAETYMGIIEQNNVATIIGSPTAATNGNINPFNLPGGYRVWWTGMKVLKLDGSQHHGIGVTPDIFVRPTIQGIRDGRDEVLERALEVVTGRRRLLRQRLPR